MTASNLTPLQLNLALTYASRTQHHSLARHISNLISNWGQRERLGEDDEDVSDDESESDVVYMETRTNALRQRVPSGNGTRNGTSGSKLVRSSLRIKTLTSNISKFNRCSERQGGSRFLNNAHHLTSRKTDSNTRLEEEESGEEGEGEGERGGEGERETQNEMTRELFSDEGEEEEEEERGSEVEVTPLSTLLPGTKRTNPFKVSIAAGLYHHDVITIHWRRNLFDFGGASVTPVITDILFAKAWGKKPAFMAKYWGGCSPLSPPGSYAYAIGTWSIIIGEHLGFEIFPKNFLCKLPLTWF